jgi:hypothetical protein
MAEKDGIDIAALQRVTGAKQMALNGWIHRKLIPGAPVDQGRGRLFDLPATLHIAVTSLLVRQGWDVGFAAMAAAEAANAFDRPGAKLLIGPPRLNVYGLGATPTIDVIDAESPEDLEEILDSFPGGRPEIYTVVALDRLGARVRAAFEEEAEQRARGYTSAFRRVARGWEP